MQLGACVCALLVSIVLTKGNDGYKPSSLLTRMVGRKSRNRVIKSMKQFAGNTDEGELIQQLDVVTVSYNNIYIYIYH